ncbi:MAG: PilW family protein [Hydrogenophilales bacterium]|nr:PilW family protein [Hydrogenophilales bacterium]
MQITQRKMRGFTIIELMVAITISALILGVLTQVYAGAKSSYRVSEALSRMQENGRYAMDYLARDIRLAGYTGCVSGGTTVNNMANPISGWSPLNTATSPITLQGIEGYEASAVTYSAISGSAVIKTDAVLIQYLSPNSAKLINPGPQNANMQISGNPLNFQQYEILVVTDCAFADIFKATSVSSSSGTVTIAHSNSNNTGNNTVHDYKEPAEVMRMQSNVYYIDTGAYGGPSLMRRRLGFYASSDATQYCTNATSSVTQGFCVEEIAEGVEDLQLLYGVDTNADLSADKFVAASSVAAADWPKVVSVRVNLLVRSVETNVSPEANTTAPTSQIPLFNNDTTYTTTTLTATPRAFRRVYTETIVLRNRAL